MAERRDVPNAGFSGRIFERASRTQTAVARRVDTAFIRYFIVSQYPGNAIRFARSHGDKPRSLAEKATLDTSVFQGRSGRNCTGEEYYNPENFTCGAIHIFQIIFRFFWMLRTLEAIGRNYSGEGYYNPTIL